MPNHAHLSQSPRGQELPSIDGGPYDDEPFGSNSDDNVSIQAETHHHHHAAPSADETDHLLSYQAGSTPSTYSADVESANTQDYWRNKLREVLLTDKYGNRYDSANVKKRLRYYFPIAGWVTTYSLHAFLYDLVTGLTVACVLVPQALSYAGLADLDPVFGLYTSFIPLIIYTILGTSRQLGAGPEAVVSILTGVAIASQNDPVEERIILASVLTFMVGIFTLALGLFRLGYLDSMLSRAANRGFIMGVALVIMVEQLEKALGLTSEWDLSASTFEKLVFVFNHIDETQLYPCLFSFLGLLFLIAFSLVKKKFSNNPYLRLFPAIMMLVIISELLSWGFGLDQQGLPVLGFVQGGFLPPTLPKLTAARVSRLTVSALVITIVGFVEAIIAAKEQANKHNSNLSDNRELVAHGMSNLINCFFNGYPSFASLTRTAIASDAGSRTPLHNFIASIFVLFTILFLLPVLYYLPKATLAAIVLHAAYSLIEVHDFIFLFKIRAWADLLMALCTTIVTIVVSVEIGIFFCILVSIGMVMKETTRPSITILGNIPGTDRYKDAATFPEAVAVDGFLILQIREPMFFANSAMLKDRIQRVERYGSLAMHPGEEAKALVLHAIVMDMHRATHIDASSLQVLFEITENYERRKISFAFARVPDSILPQLQRAGLVKGAQSVFETVHQAVAALSSAGSPHLK